MYDEFFLDKYYNDNKLPHSLRLLFRRWEVLFEGDKRPKYFDWTKASVVKDHLNYSTKKDYFSSLKAKGPDVKSNFELWSFYANPTIDDLIYLVGFCLLPLQLYLRHFFTIHPETSLLFAEMAK